MNALKDGMCIDKKSNESQDERNVEMRKVFCEIYCDDPEPTHFIRERNGKEKEEEKGRAHHSQRFESEKRNEFLSFQNQWK